MVSRRTVLKAIAAAPLVAGTDFLSPEPVIPKPLCTCLRVVDGCIMTINVYSPDVIVDPVTDRHVCVRTPHCSAFYSAWAPYVELRHDASGNLLYDVTIASRSTPLDELSRIVQIDRSSLS